MTAAQGQSCSCTVTQDARAFKAFASPQTPVSATTEQSSQQYRHILLPRFSSCALISLCLSFHVMCACVCVCMCAWVCLGVYARWKRSTALRSRSIRKLHVFSPMVPPPPTYTRRHVKTHTPSHAHAHAHRDTHAHTTCALTRTYKRTHMHI